MLKENAFDPKRHQLKFTGKSRSVENEMAKLEDVKLEYLPGVSSPRLVDPQPYSFKITRTTSTKSNLQPRITSHALPPRSPQCVNRKKATSFSDPSDFFKEDHGVDAMVKCLSRAVYYEVKTNVDDRGTLVDVFCEVCSELPSLGTVEDFFAQIFESKDLSVECAVTAAAYVDQLHVVSGIKLNNENWRKICFIAILEADKVLRDKLVWNEDYKDLIPEIDLQELRRLERAFLKYIEFNLTLKQSDYAKYYLHLISLREKVEEDKQSRIAFTLASPRSPVKK